MNSQTPRRFDRRQSLIITFITTAILTCAVLVPVLLSVGSNSSDVTRSVEAASIVRSRQVAAASQASAGCTYVIRPGDTLFRIGLYFGVSYYYLAALNGIPNPNWIFAGEVLIVPCTRFPPRIPPFHPANCAPSQTYVVQPGDNSWRIAYNFKTSLDLVRAANGLYYRVLRPGMVLTIPCPGSVQYKYVPPVTGQPQPPPVGNTVGMLNHQYNPQTISIPVGTIVTWVNNEAPGGTGYSVTSGTCSGNTCTQTNVFDSGTTLIPPGGSFTFQFNTPGIYAYYSRNYPQMTGSVNVSP